MSVAAHNLTPDLRALVADGKRDEIVEQLQQAVANDPDSAPAWGSLAWALLYAGRHADSLRCLDQVARLAPENLEVRWRRADRLIRLGRLDEAETQYRAVLEVAPQCHDARCGLQYIEWLREKRSPTEAGREPAADSGDDGSHDVCTETGTLDPRKADNERRARQHFERGDVRLTALPVYLQIESTTRCNAACVMCPRLYVPHSVRDLSPQVFERIERELLPAAVSINLSGIGEPILGRRFDAFHHQAVRHGTQIHFSCNGTALTLERLEAFARRPTHMAVSVDGATREMFESIRQKISFDRVIERLRLYKKLRDVYTEAGSTLVINFVAMRRNIEDLPAVVDLAAELGAQRVFVMQLGTGGLPPAVAAEHLAHSPDLANRVFDEAADRARRHGITIELPSKFPGAGADSGGAPAERPRRSGRLLPERDRFPQRCAHPWTTVYISVDGRVHPCCVSSRALGDLNVQGCDAIWNGRAYRRFRRRIRSFLPPLECRNCDLVSGINAGNAAAVRGREGLLIKLLYRVEIYWRRLADTLARFRRRP